MCLCLCVCVSVRREASGVAEWLRLCVGRSVSHPSQLSPLLFLAPCVLVPYLPLSTARCLGECPPIISHLCLYLMLSETLSLSIALSHPPPLSLTPSLSISLSLWAKVGQSSHNKNANAASTSPSRLSKGGRAGGRASGGTIEKGGGARGRGRAEGAGSAGLTSAGGEGGGGDARWGGRGESGQSKGEAGWRVKGRGSCLRIKASSMWFSDSRNQVLLPFSCHECPARTPALGCMHHVRNLC